MNDEEMEQTGPRMLPVVCVNGVAYFVDARVRQLREVGNPHRYIDFEVEGSPRWAAVVTAARRAMFEGMQEPERRRRRDRYV